MHLKGARVCAARTTGVSVLLAAIAALSYGIGDFSGAQASRTRSPLWVLWVARFTSLVALVVPMLLWNKGVVIGRDLLLGALGGALISTAIWLMYQSMTLAPIHFATPIAAVLAASVPVVVGTVLGERPKLVVAGGVLLSILSVAVISGLGRASFSAHTKNERLALQLSAVAGVLYGLHSVVFSKISDRSGWWPVAAEQTTGFVGALLLWLVLERNRTRLHVSIPRLTASASAKVPDASLFATLSGSPSAAPSELPAEFPAVSPSTRRGFVWDTPTYLAMLAGVFEVVAVVTFLEGSRRGLLSVVGAVVALYPAPTILLAMLVLRERPTRRQAIGLGIAGIALVAIGAGS